MANTLLSVVSEAERNAFPILSQLSENDVVNIWANVSSFIERKMSMEKGVCIPGLGTFTFSQQKLEVGSKYILIQRPVFLLSEKLSHSHCLKQTKALAVAGEVPVVPLNFAAVSAESPFDRDAVEGCVRESLLLLLRAVAALRTVLLTFQGIGVLSFRHGKVKMRFHRDFLSAMDGTGRLLWALTNRPGTSSSVVSGRLSSLLRPMTSNAISLPRISAGNLPEEGHMVRGSTPAAELHNSEEEKGREPQLSARQKSRPATAKTTTDKPTDAELDGLSDMPERHAMFLEPPEGAVDKVEVKRQDAYLSLTCTDHPRAGQELCYLCMQRAQRNIPLYLAEERRREEQEEEKALLLTEQQRVQKFLQKEQDREEQKREDSKKIAAFNLGVSEALRAKKAAKPSQYEDSYIFRGRPVTPCRHPMQKCYMQELNDQVTSRRQRCAHSRRDQDLTERLHQVQLADEIAKQRSQELHQKKRDVKILQKALSAQLEYRGMGIPARQPDSDGPVFGARDGNPSARAEQWQRARATFDEQLVTADARKRLALCQRLEQHRRERDMLQRCRKELIADRISRYERFRNLRASLEEAWNRSTDLKHLRDQEEKAFMRAGSRLLLDQCKQYRSCFQCKRKTSNCGQSNVWKDSRYIPGSRLMV